MTACQRGTADRPFRRVWRYSIGMAEERRPDRPHPGELRVCPSCRRVMRFEERYAQRQDGVTFDPAWVCLNEHCGRVDRVRVRAR